MKVITVKSWDELAKFSAFPYSEDAYMRAICRNCRNMNFPKVALVAKYKEYDCQYCGHKNPEPYLFPDAAHTYSNGVYTFIFYRN